MRSCLALSVVLAVAIPQAVVAQSPDDAGNSVHVGDQWTYERKDEITGNVIRRFTATVTEISPKEIVTHLSSGETGAGGLVVFDFGWNRTKNGGLEYQPHDANGVELPLAVGKGWRLQFFTTNTKTG